MSPDIDLPAWQGDPSLPYSIPILSSLPSTWLDGIAVSESGCNIYLLLCNKWSIIWWLKITIAINSQFLWITSVGMAYFQAQLEGLFLKLTPGIVEMIQTFIEAGLRFFFLLSCWLKVLPWFSLCRPLHRASHSTTLQLNTTVQFSPVTQSCPTLWDTMDCSTPDFPVHHQLPELAQTHVHRVSDAIQPPHPLLSPSPSTFNLFSIRIFSNESALRIRWSKCWSFSFSISPPVNIQVLFPLGLTGWVSLQSKGLSRVFSSKSVQ